MNKVKDTQTFIDKAQSIHNKKYDYSATCWTGNKTKVTIICPIHGKFEQSPNNHLSGYGCSDCAKKSRSKAQASTSSTFIDKAISIHGNTYDYSLVNYVNSKTNVTIVCEEHGTFEMTPSNHTHIRNPQGCPTCGRTNNHKNGWTISEWEAAGNSSQNFTGFRLYIIRCWNNEEEFIKIGKTFRNISDRFKNKTTMPYEWELLSSKEGSARYISELEVSLHTKYKNNKYSPKIPFGGQYECFTKDITKALDTL